MGSVKKSAVRRNFDLAHELGHLLLHYKVEFTMLDKKSYKTIEDEANSFAAEFLLPENEFRKDCEGIAKVSNPDAYIDIKEKWNVSLQAIAVRAFKLNLINYQQYRYYYMLINKKGYKIQEPLDDKISIERPMKIKSILQLLFKNNIYSLSSLMNDLKVDQGFFTVLTGIEEEFFEAYRELENKNFSLSELEIKGIK